jgi:hypothetical protein
MWASNETQTTCKGSSDFFFLKQKNKKKHSNANGWLLSERAVSCRDVDSHHKNLRRHGDTESWKINIRDLCGILRTSLNAHPRDSERVSNDHELE